MAQPSAKQIRMIEELARVHNVAIPAMCYDDARKCSEFIEKHYKASEKQIKYANDLVAQGGDTPLKPFEQMSPFEISDYITQTLNKVKVNDPTKIIKFAKVIAIKMGVPHPNYDNKEEVDEFLSKYKAEFELKFPKS